MNKSLLLKTALFSFLFLVSMGTWAEIPKVPREMSFADLTIRINEQARREIQLDVDALYRNPNYFKVKAERANLYMPLIEREFREIGVPDELKYLVIQESGLIADAVSTSNAVGFWQFKQGTAEEVSLRVDNQVDERKNIVSSSRGAALYLKKHNAHFDNWMCALVSYQMGLGGAKSYFGTQLNGKKVIEIDRNSHWYFKKFLAHKVAFENQTNGVLVSNTGYLEEVRIQGPTSLKELAPKLGVNEDHLIEYNKWANRGQIPGDKPYSVVYVRQGLPPATPTVAQFENWYNNNAASSNQNFQASDPAYPKITGNQQNATRPNQIRVNNIQGIQANQTADADGYAKNIGLKGKKFRKFNDLDKGARVEAGKYYYTDNKGTSAEVPTHIVQPGETLWTISQKYGIKLSSLKAKNRVRRDKDIRAGMVLNLQEYRVRGEDIKMAPAEELRRMAAASNPQPAQANQVPVQTASPQGNQVPVQTAPTQSNPAPVTTQPGVETPRESTSPSSGPERITHVVLQGETLFRLSQTYSVSVEDIKKWNNLSDNTIKVGQKITIIKMAAASNRQHSEANQSPSQSNPSRVTTPPSSGQERISHVVQQGETLFRLSQIHGVSVEDIKKWNNLPDNTIKVGQRITIIK